jgi:phosphatidylglycerol---prolipoprotein diacylglyceryl transferase
MNIPLLFPEFDPVALQLGPVAIHWYGLAYVVAMLVGLYYAKRLAAKHPAMGVKATTMDDMFMWVVAGVILGGRLGYVLFYAPWQFMQNPLALFAVWQGGMSFHGGLIGVVLAVLVFAYMRKVHPADLADRFAPVVPIGLLLGRLANFVNGELWGRPTTIEATPWAMVFTHVDSLPRHPSQLYEAGLEGVMLLVLLWALTRKGITRWLPTGVFLVGYGLARICVECFRTPEITHMFLGLEITQGQLLSLPMVLVGLVFLALVRR